MSHCVHSSDENCQLCITSQCWNKHPLLKKYTLGKYLSEGATGFVTLMDKIPTNKINNLPSQVVVKIIPLGPIDLSDILYMCKKFWGRVPVLNRKLAKIHNGEGDYTTSVPQFRKEAVRTRKAADLGIGPEVFDTFVCKNGLQTKSGKYTVGFIVMEKLDFTLAQIMKRLPSDPYFQSHYDQAGKQLVNLAKSCDLSGLVHPDLHSDNVMGKYVNREDKSIIKFFIIDWGLFKKFKNVEGQEINYRTRIQANSILFDVNTRILVKTKKNEDLAEDFFSRQVLTLPKNLAW
jgi:hypothetical protein